MMCIHTYHESHKVVTYLHTYIPTYFVSASSHFSVGCWVPTYLPTYLPAYIHTIPSYLISIITLIGGCAGGLLLSYRSSHIESAFRVRRW